MSKKLTYQEVKLFIDKNSECKLISDEYINILTKMRFRCKCGNEFETTFNNFKGSKNNSPKRQCNDCGKKINVKKRKKYILDDVKEFIYKHNCQLITVNYTDVNQHIEVKCVCGNIFNTTFAHFKYDNQRQCKDCGYSKTSNSLSFNYKQVKDYIEIESKSGCKLLSKDYINQEYKLKIKCSCGNTFETSFREFKRMNKRQCNTCSNCERPTIEYIKQYVLEKSQCTVLSDEYVNQKDKLRIKCKCGHIFKRNWDSIKNQQAYYCSHCTNKYKGEKRIRDFLSNKNILFEEQYRLKDCRAKYPLPFDFAVFKKGSLSLLIEYDGELHYKETGLGNNLERQKYHDKLKDEYCKKNNIKFIRIPYWEFDNIETILEGVLP